MQTRVIARILFNIVLVISLLQKIASSVQTILLGAIFINIRPIARLLRDKTQNYRNGEYHVVIQYTYYKFAISINVVKHFLRVQSSHCYIKAKRQRFYSQLNRFVLITYHRSGSRISSQGGGAYLKKLRRAEGGLKIFWVFRVKNHDFTPKNLIFSNFRGGAGCAPPLDPPLYPFSY